MPSKLELDAYDSMKQTRSTFRESNRQLAMETSKSANFKMQSVKDLRVSGRSSTDPSHDHPSPRENLIEPINSHPIVARD